MTTKTVTLPSLNSPTAQMIIHAVIVFAVAFAAQMVAGVNGNITNEPALMATLVAAAAAGVTAVVHYVLGLIPTTNEVASVLSTSTGQVLASMATVFAASFGAQWLAGAANVTSVPTFEALIVSACIAGVTAAGQALLKLVPTPAPVVTQLPPPAAAVAEKKGGKK